MTTDQAQGEGRSGFVLTYNSADPLAKAIVKDATAQLKALDLQVWDYEVDATLAQDKYDSMHETILGASSIAIVVGPDGPGRLQNAVEIGWALDAKTQRGALVTAVVLPGVDRQTIPARVSSLQAKQYLVPDDLDDRSLTDRGLATFCGVARGGMTVEEAIEWVRQRRRELGLTAPKRAKALLVGIAEYNDEHLDNLYGPGPDLDGLREVLTSLEVSPGTVWEVTDEMNLASGDLGDRLYRFFLGPDVEPDDLLLFYFSGHGMPDDEGRPYLLPSNARAAVPSTHGVSAETIRTYLAKSKALATVVILDCCHGDDVDLGPEKEAGAYGKIPVRSGVLGASRGLTPDSNRPGERSPFTNALIKALRSAPSSTISDLEQLLKAQLPSVWCRSEVDTIQLGVARQVAAEPQGQLLGRLGFATAPEGEDQVEDLRRHVQTLEALLAVAPQATEELNAVVRNSLELVLRRLRSLTRSPADDDFDWKDVGPGNSTFVEVAFQERDIERLADLPWEYLGIPPERLTQWSELAEIRRVVTVGSASKSPVTERKVRKPLVISGLPSEANALKQLTKQEVSSEAFVDEAQWGKLRASMPDLLAIQCELLQTGDMLVHPPQNDEPWYVNYVQAQVVEKPIHTLVIETIAGPDNPLAAGALRRLAVELAQKTNCAVIAVCHQSALLTRLRGLAEAGGGASDRSFIGSVIRYLAAGGNVEEAGSRARAALLAELGGGDRVVGIPVTVRPEPPRVTNARREKSPVQTSRVPRRDRLAARPADTATEGERSFYDAS